MYIGLAWAKDWRERLVSAAEAGRRCGAIRHCEQSEAI